MYPEELAVNAAANDILDVNGERVRTIEGNHRQVGSN